MVGGMLVRAVPHFARSLSTWLQPTSKTAKKMTRVRPSPETILKLDRFAPPHHFLRVIKKIFGFLLLSSLFARGGPAAAEKSVVQIMNFSQEPVWESPWRFDSVHKSSGTGFVIAGKKIMTNAHVVSWAKQIHVKRYQDPRPYPAHVSFIGHDCDLAVIEVEDQSFFDGLEPLPLGELPKVRSTVVTYGYPAGGEQISYTRGVVSRIEMQPYSHIGNRSFLGVQTDAAINPGNSGGPVIQEGTVVGVAFQGMPGLENTGFFIATPVIQHFLKDISDGIYSGFPQAGIRIVPLENPAYIKMLKWQDNGKGARIDSLAPIPSTQKLLRPDDILLKVGNLEVGSDGTVIYEGNRLAAAVAFQEVQDGETVPLKIWRDGHDLDVALPMTTYKREVNVGNQYDISPRYFIYAGLVFTPLSLDYLKSSGRAEDAAYKQLVYELYYHLAESPSTARSEPIVLSTTLADPVNANLTIQSRQLVDKINGVRIDKLEDVARAFAQGTNTYQAIEFLPEHAIEVLDRVEAEKVGPRVLQTYNIPSDRHL